MLDRLTVPDQNPVKGFPGRLPEASAKSPTKRRQSTKVLVVDDEPLIRWSLSRGLTKRGHEVREAASAAEAMNVLSSEAGFDAVLLDYRLPDRNDLSLLRSVRELVPTARVLMMTAYGEPGMREEALALGALTVVDKPFQITEVVELIESA
jgi:DNA-binding NtrC family response regulator